MAHTLTQAQQQIVQDPQTYATTMLVLAFDRFGLELTQWDPETISMSLVDAFGAVPRSNFNKLMAAVEIVTSNTFYASLPDFIRLCNTLYNGTFDPREFDPADAGEISWGITEALLLWPPDHDEEKPFTQAILAYIGHAVRAEGIMVPPDVLRLGIQDDANLWNSVQSAYSDEPAMFDAIYDAERAKTDEINAMVKARLAALLEQLESLQLEHGNASNAVRQMLAAVKQERQQGREMQPALPQA